MSRPHSQSNSLTQKLTSRLFFNQCLYGIGSFFGLIVLQNEPYTFPSKAPLC